MHKSRAVADDEYVKDWAEAQLWGPRENVEAAMNHFAKCFGDYEPGQKLVSAVLEAADKQYKEDDIKRANREVGN